MADYLFSILDSRTLSKFYFSIPHCSPQIPCIPVPALSFDNPRTARRRKKKPLHLSLLANNNQEPTFGIPSSSNLDIVSFHEHSDGSVIFRFGEPSEVAKNDVLKESNATVEEVGCEDKEKFRTVKVLDGQYEREVIVKRIEREDRSQVKEEATDVANSALAIGSGGSRVADEVSELCDKLIKDPKRVQLPVSASSIEVEKIEKQEGNQESNAADVADSMMGVGRGSSSGTDGLSRSSEKFLEDSKHVQLPVSASSAEVNKTEKEEGSQGSVEIADVTEPNGCESGRVTDEVSESSEKLLEEPKDYQLPVSTSSAEVQKVETEEGSQGSNEAVDVANSLMAIGGENSGVTDGESESSEKLLEDSKEVQLPGSVSSAEVEDSSSFMVDTESGIHDEEIPSSVLVLDKSSELDNGSSHGEVLAKRSSKEEALKSVSLKSDSDIEKGDNNGVQENTVEDFELLDSSMHAEDQGVVSMLQNVPEDSSESNAIEVMPLSSLSKAEPILDEEAENDTIEEFGREDATEKFLMIVPSCIGDDDSSQINNLPNRILEAERRADDSQSSNLLGVSDHEPTESKSTDPKAEMNTNKFPISDLPKVSDLGLIDLERTEVSLASKQAQTSEFVLSSAAALLPHPSKVLTGGDDAYFIASQNWSGVADGVGQWSLEGTNPGVYAQELMDNFEKTVSDGNRSILTTPEEVLRLSVAKSQSCGFSTVLVSHFDGQVLNIANIGDSGFVILRNGAVHKKSSPMFHEFSFPIQIGSGNNVSEISQGYKVELDEGDIIVIATDGLFDNLYEREIASIVSKLLEAAKGPKEIAEALATRAQEVGSCASARSPFGDAAQAAGYVGYTGGKLDDVTVIVSLVQNAA